VAYATQQAAQQWLQRTKYQVVDIDDEIDDLAANAVITALTRRYDTTTWVDTASTPPLAVNLINMLYASYWLRRSTSEDDGAATYCDWLDKRADAMIKGLTSGNLDLPGVDPDEDSADVGVPEFWPTQAATDLWFEDPTAEGAAARAFDMQKQF
jgi:hypothetical protein